MGHMPSRTTSSWTLSRRTLLAGVTLTLAGCSLRLEKDAPLPGPKATAGSDTKPLEAVRDQLRGVVASAEADNASWAHTSLGVHRSQLTRLDATLKGLGSSASASPSSEQPRSDWSASEKLWSSQSTASTLARVSRESRPMAMAIAAVGSAYLLRSGGHLSWPSEAKIPAGGAAALLSALDPAIDVFEWQAARTDPTKRDDVKATLTWLYAARSMAEARSPRASSGKPSPLRSYDDVSAQTQVIATLKGILSACATSAASAATPREVTGVLMTWSNAVADLDQHGTAITAFPGLADTQH